jgi:uncharacterized protein (TIGR02270 family)
MNSSELQRPIGFSPGEISALVNEPVIEQHAEEAAFLWTMRDRAVRSPNYKLKDLHRLDERVEAHLDGLRVTAQFGREVCERLLNDKKEVGEVFATALLAFDAGDTDLIDKVLLYSKVYELARGVISALGWLPFNQVENRMRELLSDERPEVRRVGIAAFAAHRFDPGRPLRDAMADGDPFLRARALLAIGELGRVELLPTLRSGFADRDQNVRFTAAWSAARLSENLDSLAILRTIAESTSPRADQALQIAIRRMDLAAAKSWQTSLANNKDKLRIAVVAAGAIGDPALVPWVIEQMRFPQVARVAGHAFSMITGADLAYEDLDGDKPESFEAGPSENAEDSDVSMDLDESLGWPVPAMVTQWWNKHRPRFQSGRRYFRGKEITVESLRDGLVNGTQLQRATAALGIALRDPTRPLFEVRARGHFQLIELNKCS